MKKFIFLLLLFPLLANAQHPQKKADSTIIITSKFNPPPILQKLILNDTMINTPYFDNGYDSDRGLMPFVGEPLTIIDGTGMDTVECIMLYGDTTRYFGQGLGRTGTLVDSNKFPYYNKELYWQFGYEIISAFSLSDDSPVWRQYLDKDKIPLAPKYFVFLSYPLSIKISY